MDETGLVFRDYSDRELLFDSMVERRTTEVRPTNDTLLYWHFANKLSIGDIVIAKIGRSILIENRRVESDYEYDKNQPRYT